MTLTKSCWVKNGMLGAAGRLPSSQSDGCQCRRWSGEMRLQNHGPLLSYDSTGLVPMGNMRKCRLTISVVNGGAMTAKFSNMVADEPRNTH
jgi:hypothetical protein